MTLLLKSRVGRADQGHHSTKQFKDDAISAVEAIQLLLGKSEASGGCSSRNVGVFCSHW